MFVVDAALKCLEELDTNSCIVAARVFNKTARNSIETSPGILRVATLMTRECFVLCFSLLKRYILSSNCSTLNLFLIGTAVA
jgi:hypothetical protein